MGEEGRRERERGTRITITVHLYFTKLHATSTMLDFRYSDGSYLNITSFQVPDVFLKDLDTCNTLT